MNLPINNEFRKELLNKCAPPTQNNERKIMGKKIEIWNKSMNESVGEEIAERFGLNFNYKSGTDYGNEITNE